MTGPVLHVVGARPNMPKAAPVLRALASRDVPQLLVHTGQHYDDVMSASLIRDLGMPEPDINLGIGSGPHGRQTGLVLQAIEPLLVEHQPAIVVVYGDVNSTLAAALAAVKLHIAVAHVEAGLRSFDRTMPEEINRRLVDHVSDLLLVTAPEGLVNLAAEGVDPARCHLVGNPMIDSLVATLGRIDAAATRTRLGLPHDYVLATMHRPANIDDEQTARTTRDVLAEVATRIPVVLPVHPRSRVALAHLDAAPGVLIRDPLDYPDFLAALAGARAVITDSGGVQEETTSLGVSCLTMRTTTERPITITHGTNRLVAPADVLRVLDEVLQSPPATTSAPPLWDGRAGERIADVLVATIATADRGGR